MIFFEYHGSQSNDIISNVLEISILHSSWINLRIKSVQWQRSLVMEPPQAGATVVLLPSHASIWKRQNDPQKKTQGGKTCIYMI